MPKVTICNDALGAVAEVDKAAVPVHRKAGWRLADELPDAAPEPPAEADEPAQIEADDPELDEPAPDPPPKPKPARRPRT